MKNKNVKLRSCGRMMALLALILLVGVGMTGCMGRSGGNNANSGVNEDRVVQPSPSPDYMPRGGAAGMNAAGTAGVQDFDWTANAAQIEGKIAQLSEISEARVVVEGNTALVAVKFNPSYRGEMTERIRGMVAAEVMQADPRITTVAVTADEEDVGSVYELSDRILGGTPLEELKEKINEIVRNATTLR